MTGSSGSDPRRNADHGTRLGLGTRILTAIVLLPIRAGRIVGRWLRTAASPVHRVLAVIGSGLRALTAAARAVASRVGGAVRAIARPVARVGRHIVAIISRALAAAARAGITVLRPVGRAIRRTTAALGHAIAIATHAIAVAAHAVATSVGRTATALGRGLATVLRPAGTAIRHTATAMGHAIAVAAHAVATSVGRAATTIGRGLATVLRPAGTAIRHTATATGHAIAVATRAVATSVGRTATALGRGLATVLRPAGTAIRRSWDRGVAVLLGAVTSAMTVGRRMRHSVGVVTSRVREASAPIPMTWDPGPTSGSAANGNGHVPPFVIEVFHQEYLPASGTRVDAIVRVVATAAGEAPHERPPTSEVILVDCSGSMGHPWRKIRSARAATRAAIDALPDGAWFAVVRANHDAEVVFPPHGGLAPKSPESAAAAGRALHRLVPEGGTAMGRWLLLARDLLESRPGTIPHAILLTDGRNESESPDALAAAVRACAGRFRCDCRGVGTDWQVTEVRQIADNLLGTVDIVPSLDDLAADFRSVAIAAAERYVDRVAVQVWTPADAHIRSFRQVMPHIADLDDHPVPIDARTVEFATGAWGAESREYHLSIELPARPAGSEALAARVGLSIGGLVTTRALVTAEWTDDVERATAVVPEVAHYTGQVEMQRAVHEGMEARRRGDTETATRRLGDAARLAFRAGNDATLSLIAAVVDVEDAATGRVHPKAVVDDADAMALEARSSRTKRLGTEVPVAH